MEKETKEKIIDNLEKKKRYFVSSEELGGWSTTVEARNLSEAEGEVLDLIDIHEVDENGEIID